MRFTRPQVLRALPTIAVNLVPLYGVVELGWPVVTLFLLFILETWLLIAIMSMRVAIDPRGGIMNAFGIFLVPSMFVLIQLTAAILVLDPKTFAARSGGDLFMDFPRYVLSLGLGWPLAVMALVHGALALRDEIQRKDVSERPFVRIFVMIVLFIFALGPTMGMQGNQSWALVALVIIKCAFEIWYQETTRTYDAWVAGIEKERRDYQASLDPRGRGSWPTPPPDR